MVCNKDAGRRRWVYQLARPVIQKCMSIKMYEHVTIGDRVLEVGSSGINLKSLLG